VCVCVCVYACLCVRVCVKRRQKLQCSQFYERINLKLPSAQLWLTFRKVGRKHGDGNALLWSALLRIWAVSQCKFRVFFCRWSSSASAGWSSWLATIQLLTRTCKPVRLGSSLSHECSLALANASLPLQKTAHSVVRVLKTHHCFITELKHLSWFQQSR
jgi:hypothetical protein